MIKNMLKYFLFLCMIRFTLSQNDIGISFNDCLTVIGCQDCRANKNKCSSCKQGLGFNPPDTNGQCICKSNLYLTIDQDYCATCQQIILNCDSCIQDNKTRITNCQKCQNQYILSNNTCTNCYSPYSPCFKCRSYDYCEDCGTNIRILESGVCILCSDKIEGCFTCYYTPIPNITCYSCHSNYYYDLATKLCISCKKVDINCDYCSNWNKCTYCDKGYYLDGRICISCTQLDIHCVQCNNLCTLCSVGYYLSNYNCKPCYLYDANCKKCNSSNCTSCSNELVPSGQKCVSCDMLIQNCKNCSNQTTCEDCKDSYYLYDTHCLPCRIGCLSCQNSSICVRCSDNYDLIEGICTDNQSQTLFIIVLVVGGAVALSLIVTGLLFYKLRVKKTSIITNEETQSDYQQIK